MVAKQVAPSPSHEAKNAPPADEDCRAISGLHLSYESKIRNLTVGKLLNKDSFYITGAAKPRNGALR